MSGEPERISQSWKSLRVQTILDGPGGRTNAGRVLGDAPMPEEA